MLGMLVDNILIDTKIHLCDYSKDCWLVGMWGNGRHWLGRHGPYQTTQAWNWDPTQSKPTSLCSGAPKSFGPSTWVRTSGPNQGRVKAHPLADGGLDDTLIKAKVTHRVQTQISEPTLRTDGTSLTPAHWAYVPSTSRPNPMCSPACLTKVYGPQSSPKYTEDEGEGHVRMGSAGLRLWPTDHWLNETLHSLLVYSYTVLYCTVRDLSLHLSRFSLKCEIVISN